MIERNIWTPNTGMVPPGWSDALQAVKDYDPTLTLGRREDDGEWVVAKMNSEGPPHPVYSLGKAPEAPSREVIMEKLSKADVQRNGNRIIESVMRNNERIKEEKRAASSEAAGEWVEYAEHATRSLRGEHVKR